MKIFIIVSINPFVNSSATGNRWLTLIEGLSNLGAKIELLIYGGYQSEGIADIWNTAGNINMIDYQYIAPQIIKGYLKRRYYTYIGETLREGHLVKLILKELDNKDGIVWTDSSYFCFKLAVKIKKQQPKRLLLLELSEFLDIHKYNKGNFLQRWKANKRQKFFEGEAFHIYDGLVLITRTLLNHYESFHEPKPEFLHLPMTVDLARFADEKEPLLGFTKPYIAFVGVMNDAKDGVSILIQAFARIANEFPELKLYLIGGWNYDTPTHQKLITDYHLEHNIFWKGEFKRDQIPSIIKNAALLALPRPDSKQAQGGFPTKLGEYLATGNPVCCTAVGEIPDYLIDGESVYFAEPGSVDSFSNALRRALSNPEEAKRIGLSGRKVAEKYFNKDIQVKTLYKFLKENLQSLKGKA